MTNYIDCGTDDITCRYRQGLIGHGNPKARIMLIADTVSEYEYKQGTFAGKAGKLFDTLFSTYGVDGGDCYYTSVIKSPMPMTDKRQPADPTQRDILAWKPVLASEIAVVDPDIIVPLGNVSLKLTYGTTGITKLRGNAVEREVEGRTRIVFPTVHPDLVFRQPKHTDSLLADLKNLGTLVRDGFGVKQKAGVEYRYLETVEEIEAEINRLRVPGQWLCWDLETTGLSPFRDTSKQGCISLSDRTHYGVTIPIDHPGFVWSPADRTKVLGLLRGLLEDETVPKFGHNIKFDMLWELATFGIDVANVAFDTMIAHYFLYSQDAGTHGLKKLAWEFTDMGGYDNALDEYKKEHGIQGNYNLIPWEILREYASADVDCAFRLFEVFKPAIDANPKFVELMKQYMQASYAIRNIEYNGAYLDVAKLKTFDEIYQVRIQQLEEQLQTYPEILEIEREKEELFRRRQLEMKKPKDERDPEILKWNKYKNFKFNFGSTAQLRELLFDKLGLTTPFKTDKGEPSTKADSLEHMAKQHPIVNMLTELRKVTKLYGTYIEPAYEWPDEAGLIHPTFNLTGCVAPETKILTDRGYVPLYEIIDCSDYGAEPGVLRAVIDPDIKVFDGEEYRRPLSGYFSGNVEMLRIRTVPKREIICTLNHRLANDYGWVQADTLRRGDELVIHDHKSNRFSKGTITMVRDEYGPAFDLIMDEYDPRRYHSSFIELNDGTVLNENRHRMQHVRSTRMKQYKNL